MRAVSSSVMAALVVVALFWGNCLSCPQMLLSLSTHQVGHSCCHHKQTNKVQCQSQAVRHFVKAEAGEHVPVLAVVDAVAVDQTAARPAAPRPAGVPVEYTPPDILSLQSSLRI